MITQRLNWINIGIAGATLLTWVGILWLWHEPPLEMIDPQIKKRGELKNAFELPAESYAAISDSFISLHQEPPTLQLPDLRQQLLYLGRNGRPDAISGDKALHLAFNGGKPSSPFPSGEKIYILCEKGTPVRYQFSPDNQPTALWIIPTLKDNALQVSVAMADEEGKQIVEPAACALFTLPEKEGAKTATASWEMGGIRVDGTLLARQRARWYGHDLFLENHGGEEYEGIAKKQRVDFGDDDATYSLFVSPGDSLIWQDDKWQQIEPGEKTLAYPLLVVKKIDDRLMSFELWDVDGKGKVPLNLLKSSDPSLAHQAKAIPNQFKFIGARTHSQYVFEINRERFTLAPYDWLLFTPKGWRKLATEKDIDDYVERRLLGALLVFEGVTRQGDNPHIVGRLYNSSRTEFQEVEIALAQGGAPTREQHKPQKQLDKAQVVEDDDDDDDEDDDDDDHVEQEKNKLPPRPPININMREREQP